MINDEIDDRYNGKQKTPLTARIMFDNGSHWNIKYPEEYIPAIDKKAVGGEWISFPETLTDDQREWIFKELGQTLRGSL